MFAVYLFRTACIFSSKMLEDVWQTGEYEQSDPMTIPAFFGYTGERCHLCGLRGGLSAHGGRLLVGTAGGAPSPSGRLWNLDIEGHMHKGSFCGPSVSVKQLKIASIGCQIL